jgi:hypothetical protein
MRGFEYSRVLLAIAVFALLTGPVWAQSDDVEGRLVVGAPGPSTVQVEGVPGSLTTLFASDNGFAGNTFDIENIGADPIDITGWDVNLDVVGGPHTIEIYWRVGTSVGFENSSAGWTLLGSDAAVTSAGDNNPSAVTMPPFTIQPGELFGFYVDLASFDGTTLLRYTNGGPTVFSNTELSLTTYVGKGNPAFTGGTFPYRQWNGTVHYDIVPVELRSFSVE